MTTFEVAKALGVQIRTVRKYMYDGELAYTKIGNRCDISAEEVARFKAEKADKAHKAEELREYKDRQRRKEIKDAQDLRALKAYIKSHCYDENGNCNCRMCDMYDTAHDTCLLCKETISRHGSTEARRVFGELW